MAKEWQTRFTDIALAAVSRSLMLRDALLGVTQRLRRHSQAEDVVIRSGDRRLAAVYVPQAPGAPVLLLCHGIGETVEHWSAAQALLRDRGVGSLVFNYAGYGRSTGKLSARHCDEDFVAAYADLRRHAGAGTPIYVLGFSLGSGIAAKGYGALQPQPAGLFLCEAFTSFREAACAAGAPQAVVQRLVPPLWETEKAVKGLDAPVWIVHSDGDRLFPVAMAERIAEAGSAGTELVVVEGLEHNEPFLKAVERYWEPIVERMFRSNR